MASGPAATGVTIRTATANDADTIGLITVAASLSAFVGNIPEHKLDLGWRPEDSAAGWRRTIGELPATDHFLVAGLDGQVVGFIWATPARDGPVNEGEVRGLYVLPTRQRRGVGRALLAQIAACFRGQGICSLVIGCIRENPSCGFYERLGGVEAYRKPNVVDRYPTVEIFYRWPDISHFIS